MIKKDPEGSDHDMTNFRMISLALNIGKLYHTLEFDRTLSFLVRNEYLDPTFQKAYLNDINGCVEHVTVLKEVLQHAKSNKNSVYVTWIDMEDCFGSLCHQLIPFTMKHYNFPPKIIQYVEIHMVLSFFTNQKTLIVVNYES